MYAAYLRFLNKMSRRVLGVILGLVLNYETKLKRNEQNKILRNAKKYTKRRNETQCNETKFTIIIDANPLLVQSATKS